LDSIAIGQKQIRQNCCDTFGAVLAQPPYAVGTPLDPFNDDAAKANRVRNSFLNSVDGPFVIEWVERCADGVRRLRQEGAKRIAAVLANLFLPDCDGIQTFERLFLAAPEVPILVLSSSACEGSARLAVQRGAQDYLLEDDLDGYLLPKAVRNMIERTSNVEALFREKERAQVTLNSIGDAVVSTDIAGNVTFFQSNRPGHDRLVAGGRHWPTL